jgi:hypothetical protein
MSYHDHQQQSLLLVLNPDILGQILLFLDGFQLVKCAQICRKISEFLKHPHTNRSVWNPICQLALPKGIVKKFSVHLRVFKNKKKRDRKISSSQEPIEEMNWKNLFFKTPHCRYDGIYVLSVSYLTPGSLEKPDRLPNVLSYHRYLRFFPKRRVLYGLLNYDLQTARNWIGKASVNDNRNFVHEHAKFFWGTFKFSDRFVCVEVNVGHLILKFKLELFWNRLEVVEFIGIHPDDVNLDDVTEFSSPNPWFEFKQISW